MITGRWLYCIALCFVWFIDACSAAINPVYQWGPWSSLPLTCSVTCGRGVRCRTRKCLDAYGNVQSSTELCSNPEDFESKAESCTTCVVRSRCPRLPGWSAWSSWSRCLPKTEGEQTRAPNGCLLGVRIRSRKCDNPSPEPPPFGIPCTGSSRQTSECSYNCDERPDIAPDNVAKQVHLQVESDHRTGLRSFQTVLRKRVGESVKMDCSTPAYKLAKRLSVAGTAYAAQRAFSKRRVSITWYKNGQKVETSQPESQMPSFASKQSSKPMVSSDPLLDEELRWMSLLQPSTSYVEGESLILPSVAEGDQGFYTCELRVDDYRWTTIFYSLIVVGVRYLAQVTDPFYLHSNLGFSNALARAPVWLEAAQIIWTHNGLFQSRGLVARLSRRIQKIDHLNYTHEGIWLCFLIIPAPGPMSRVSKPLIRVAGSYLINEFHLKINPSSTSLWQVAEHPSSIRLLRNVSVTLSVICLFLVLFLLLTIWAARRWIHRSLSNEQTRAIVQELMDNQCRLMLTARRRASINKDRLLPLILQEHQRLERTNRHLNERLAHKIAARKMRAESDSQSESTKSPKLNFGERLNDTFQKLRRRVSNRSSSKQSITDAPGQKEQESDTTVKTKRINPLLRRKKVENTDEIKPITERASTTKAEDKPVVLEENVTAAPIPSASATTRVSTNQTKSELMVVEPPVKTSVVSTRKESLPRQTRKGSAKPVSIQEHRSSHPRTPSNPRTSASNKPADSKQKGRRKE